MKHHPSHLWILMVVFPVIVLGLLTYSLNQPPSAPDVRRVLGARAHLDRLIPLGNQLLALSHTATTFNHALIVRRWGALELLQTGQYSMTDTPAGHGSYSYQPMFLPPHSVQLLQGQVSTPSITHIQVRLDNGEHLDDIIADTAFGIAYTGDQGLCSLELLDAQQRLVEQIPLEPYVPNGADRHAYDCQP